MSTLREACGVLGLYSRQESASRLVYFGLHALQHRGQEAAGIALTDGTQIRVHKGLGLVTQVFTEANLSALEGTLAIGHTRYSTTGVNTLENAQPFLLETSDGPLALAHNGNLTNFSRLLRTFPATEATAHSDSALMARMLAESTGSHWVQRLKNVMRYWEGAYCLVLLTRHQLLAVRDPWGFRPLHLSELPCGSYAIASETGALHTLGGRKTCEIAPGEIVLIGEQGLERHQGQPPAQQLARCTFEHIYFSRPDTVWDGLSVHTVRQKLGAQLAYEMQASGALAKLDLVIPVPDSAIPAAIGFAHAARIPYNDGFIKNRYIGRTFIQPTNSLRKQGVTLKFNALPHNLRGRHVMMIDDSIVRGNTSGLLVQLLREAGARTVHLGITCPPIRHPCYMGVDMGTYDELIARTHDTASLQAQFDCDSLHFLSLEGIRQALDKHTGYCNACFTGRYPLPIESSTQSPCNAAGTTE